jgi:hypothetical protein
MGVLIVQYLGVFAITTQTWPVNMAMVKLVSGLTSVFILWLASSRILKPVTNPSNSLPTGKTIERPFLLSAGMLVGLVIYSQIPEASKWLVVAPKGILWAGLFLGGSGLLKLGFTDQPMPACVGLLTALSGFEILYSVVQSSILMAGLLACVNFGLATAGAYLILSPSMEAE